MKANHSGRLAPVAAVVLFGIFSSTLVQADDTGWLSPEDGDGFYTQWGGSGGGTGGATVNDGIGCAGVDVNTYWTAGLDTYRASAIITIPATVPDGATIDSVDVQVCQSRGIAGSPPTGATFQTFVRVDSTNTDSGTNISSSSPPSNTTEHIQTIPLGVVRTPTTVLQAGGVKTNGLGSQRIYTLAARINYTIPGSTTTVSCTSPIAIGNTSTCTATIAPSAGSTTPSGAVTWSSSDAGTFSGESCTPGTGSLSCTATFTPAGLGGPIVTATFAGDANMTGSNGTDDVQVVVPGSATTVSCTSPIEIGDTSACTATIAPSSGSVTPTGAVTWSTSDAGTFSGETCTPGVGSLTCNAVFTPSAVGAPTVTATFAGDTNMTGSNGAAVVQVNEPFVPPEPRAVPVFGLPGFLLTVFGITAIGGWYSRRRY